MISSKQQARANLIKALAGIIPVVSDYLSVKGYDPDQPRVPAGSPEGGQWTSEGGGGNGKESDHNPVVGKLSEIGGEVHEIRDASNLAKDYRIGVIKMKGEDKGNIFASISDVDHADILNSVYGKVNEDDFVRFRIWYGNTIAFSVAEAGYIINEKSDEDKAIDTIYRGIDYLLNKGLPAKTNIIIDRYYGNAIETSAKSIRILFQRNIAGELKYDPDQPRVPAGSPEGGQWTSEGEGGGHGGLSREDYADFSNNSQEIIQTYGSATYGDWKNSLNKDEFYSLENYIQDDTYSINQTLRSNQDLENPRLVDYKFDIDNIDSALSKSEIPEPTISYRYFGKFDLDELKAGDIIHDRGYTSTTINPFSDYMKKTFSGDLAEIRIPAGIHGAFISLPDLGLPKENELLLERGLKFQYIGKEGGRFILQVIKH